jgi:xylulose-5-phosphate/fructose-6-phosphate phosphoketolase
MQRTLQKAYSKIKEAQQLSRSKRPLMPMIILRTDKGWTGVKSLNGLKVEGNYPSHQVVLGEAKGNGEQLGLLQTWLGDYRINELFDAQTGFSTITDPIMPTEISVLVKAVMPLAAQM